jgi:hypothetical protein
MGRLDSQISLLAYVILFNGINSDVLSKLLFRYKPKECRHAGRPLQVGIKFEPSERRRRRSRRRNTCCGKKRGSVS